MSNKETPVVRDFIRQRIDADLAAGKNDGRVVTRFPPEPNGYLHIGHAKSACLNFGIAEEYDDGLCSLRFDDTNPTKEKVEYVEAIKEDVRWLGFDWGDRLRHASDYFDQLYEFAAGMIRSGRAYVDSLSGDELRAHRGTLTEPGRESPYRERGVGENLELFQRMRAGEFPNGSHVLRAKIDMASPNINMRDPVMYRIMHAAHPMTRDKWCIYPMYDFTHCLSDYIEGVTHSLCTLEFEDHRPLYDWYLEAAEVNPRPQQIEFSRLNLSYTVMSKRLLNTLVNDGHVSGWDDPRMPTLKGMRRRGFTPESIRDFCERIGVTKKDNVVEMGVLENCVREDLDPKVQRVMCVLNPLKLVITNYPDGAGEMLEAQNHPKNPDVGVRQVPFSKTIYIERDDFMESPPSKFFRLAPGREVRLRYAYLVTCVQVIHDSKTGEVSEIHCTYDPESRGGNAPDGRKVKGTIHWVCGQNSLQAEVRLYDRLFKMENPLAALDDKGFEALLNPDSVEILSQARIEPSVKDATAPTRFQFERQGYFCVDSVESRPDALVFNRTVTLRDTWAKLSKGDGR
ncbi:MAG: glutamine--tRNA ligase/YqeY domain fusion protein [Gammaproteobacteria bacterium]|nr:glutamine--tRNA ligase/YqeY domain fusion protein [Gammaproteobacteria bacterium]